MKTLCPSCDSSAWTTIKSCTSCSESCCDQCGEVVASSPYGCLICASCLENPNTLYLVEPRSFEDALPEDPISPEQYRRVIDCKTVAEVRAVFSVPVRPIRRAERVRGTGQERRAA